MVKGDLILVPFPFTDLSGKKLRPDLELVATKTDVTVAFFATQLQWKEATDVWISPSEITGLKKGSLVRLSKLAALDKDLVLGCLGSVNNQTTK